MKYALGNMLNGAGGLNADQLALDLQFAADKSLTARKGPTPVFTRGSAATLVNSAGLIEYAPENLILQSETLGTTWTQTNVSVSSNVAVAPDGNTTADKIVENTSASTHGVDQQTTFTAIPYTLSFYAKKDGRTWVRAFISGLASTWFNIDNGTLGTVAAGFTASITNAGNGWYRCSITGTASAGTLSSGVRMSTTDGNNSYLGDGTSGVFIWGVQLEAGSAAKAYNRTTTSAFYGPRFDHDPVTLASKGLLIEESRTNVALRSGAIVNDSGWFQTGATLASSGTGPDGNTSYQATETTVNGNHLFGNFGSPGNTPGTSIVSGTTYTGSIFLKKVSGSVDWVQLTFGSGGFGVAQYANFNISNGTVGNSAGLASGTSPRIEDYGNGWYRCSMVATATVTTTGSNLVILFIDNTNGTTRGPSYAGSTSNQVLAAMCQFEAGTFATSYIPTTTASVVRSADVCSISGAGFTGMWNALEGSLLTSAIFNAPVAYGTSQATVDINDNTTANRLRFFRGSASGFGSFANTSNSTQNVSIVATSASQPFTTQKYASGFKLDDYAFYINNSQIGTDNLGAMPISPTTFTIGDASAAFSPRLYLNGTISSIRYYRKRLPNAKLQAITV